MVIKTDRPRGAGSNPKKRILDLPALIKYNLEHSIISFTPTCKMSDIEAKPKRVLTDEQKAKMKAGREAAKARKAAEADAAAAGGVPALAAAPGGGLDLEEEVPVQLVDWEHDFGTGAKLYKLLSYEGQDYIYDHATREYLGAYMKKTNKLKKTVADPLAPEDD